MAIFVNSWPAGIALCLLVVPAIAGAHGVTSAVLASTAFCGIGLILFAALYTPATGDASVSAPVTSWPRRSIVLAVIMAGCIWGLFNAALSMVFSFGPTMLVERNWSLAAAGSVTSLALWIVTASVPLGGYLADRTGKRTEVMLIGFVLFAVALLTAKRTDAVVPAFVVLGLFGGLSAGPIMSLPARVLAPEVRATGMGIYFTLFYAGVVLAPIFAGILSRTSGSAGAAFDLGATMLAVCFPAYWAFSRLAAGDAIRPQSKRKF